MIEVLFGESEAGAMKLALQSGKLGKDAVCLGFHLDVGDIKKPVAGDYRAKLLYNLLYQKQWGADIEMKRELKQLGSVYSEELNKLCGYLKNGEQIRVWYSDAPYSLCGLMWLCELIGEYPQARDIYAVELPRVIMRGDAAIKRASWGEVEPDEFEKLLPLQKRLKPFEITINAVKWEALRAQNAPLRATVNGSLMSVPASFYDFLILKYLSDEPITEALLIGRIMGENSLGIGDYQYARRIDKLIENKRITILENSPKKYERLIAKTAL